VLFAAREYDVAVATISILTDHGFCTCPRRTTNNRNKRHSKEGAPVTKAFTTNYGFFEFFDRHIALTIEACRELQHMAEQDGDFATHVSRIKDLEHETDRITHQCIEAFHETFITPI